MSGFLQNFELSYAPGVERWHSLRVAACMIAWVTLAVRTAVAESPGREDSRARVEDGASSTSRHVDVIQKSPEASATDEEGQLRSARFLFWKAYEQFKNGNFTRAVKTFEQVYALMPEPAILYNIALAHAKNGDCTAAEGSFSDYSRAGTSEQKLQRAALSFAKALAQCTVLAKEEATAGSGELEPNYDESRKVESRSDEFANAVRPHPRKMARPERFLMVSFCNPRLRPS